MATAKPVTPPSGRISGWNHSTPVSARTAAVTMFCAFAVGGLLVSSMSWWAFVIVGVVIAAIAYVGTDRYGRARG